jgi:hypothetical protein
MIVAASKEVDSSKRVNSKIRRINTRSAIIFIWYSILIELRDVLALETHANYSPRQQLLKAIGGRVEELVTSDEEVRKLIMLDKEAFGEAGRIKLIV